MSPHAEIDNSTYASPEPSHYVAKAAAIAASAPAPTGSLKVHTIEKATDGVMRIKIRVRPSSLARHTLLIHGNGMDLEQEKLFATEIQFACDKDNGAHNRVCAFYVSAQTLETENSLVALFAETISHEMAGVGSQACAERDIYELDQMELRLTVFLH